MKIALVGASECALDILSHTTYDYYLALDGGYRSCKQAGIEPHAVWGDFDSLGYVPDDAGVDLRVFPIDKDKSDLALGFDEVERLLAQADAGSCVHVFGALGGRIDHTIAALNVAAQCADEHALSVWFIGVGSSVCVIPAGVHLDFCEIQRARLQDGSDQSHFVSIQAWGGPAQASAEGFKYELSNAKLEAWTSLGLSNEWQNQHARVSVHAGMVLLTVSTRVLIDEGIVPMTK